MIKVTYFDIFENSPIVRIYHYIIYCIRGQPNINFYIKVAKRTFGNSDLHKRTLYYTYTVAYRQIDISLNDFYSLDLKFDRLNFYIQ